MSKIGQKCQIWSVNTEGKWRFQPLLLIPAAFHGMDEFDLRHSGVCKRVCVSGGCAPAEEWAVAEAQRGHTETKQKWIKHAAVKASTATFWEEIRLDWLYPGVIEAYRTFFPSLLHTLSILQASRRLIGHLPCVRAELGDNRGEIEHRKCGFDPAATSIFTKVVHGAPFKPAGFKQDPASIHTDNDTHRFSLCRKEPQFPHRL